MASVTTQVQMAVRTIPLGALFTARDVAELLEVQSGTVGQILSRGVRGAEPCDRLRAQYDYPSQSTSKTVCVYRRVPFNE